MHHDAHSRYRSLFQNNPPQFIDYVDTLWETVPDLPEFNDKAYKRIIGSLTVTKQQARTRCILVLGEAGTGKTHLLTRVARNLGGSNHILFVRRPNNEEAVAQHVWANIVESLTHVIPEAANGFCQLDDLLAHVFSAVLIPVFKADIEKGGSGVEQRQKWLDLLQANPFSLFTMLGKGEQRIKNMQALRRKTLRYLSTKHPDVDQNIAHALITYCFVSREDRKRLLLKWLSGQDIMQEEAKVLGLPDTWVTFFEGMTDKSLMQQREEQALRAVRSIGVLSTYYQPLILAFDQLEGLDNDEQMTKKWGDVVKEIITMAPNFLVITCLFPSLWKTWFSRILDQGCTQRISSESVVLEAFSQEYAKRLLAKQMEESCAGLSLPDPIYPFTDKDVSQLCSRSTSPRLFIQAARNAFKDWLDGADDIPSPVVQPVHLDDIDSLVKESLFRFENEERRMFQNRIPLEQDFFGRVRNLFRTLSADLTQKPTFGKLSIAGRVMPDNVLVRSGTGFCVAVLNSEGNHFTARLKNFLEALQTGFQIVNSLIVRDERCGEPGAAGKSLLDAFQAKGGFYLKIGGEEWARLNAIYDAMVAVEQQDLTIGTHVIDRPQLIESLRGIGACLKVVLLREAATRAAWLNDIIRNKVASVPTKAVTTPPGITSNEILTDMDLPELVKLAHDTRTWLPWKPSKSAARRLLAAARDTVGTLPVGSP